MANKYLEKLAYRQDGYSDKKHVNVAVSGGIGAVAGGVLGGMAEKQRQESMVHRAANGPGGPKLARILEQANKPAMRTQLIKKVSNGAAILGGLSAGITALGSGPKRND